MKHFELCCSPAHTQTQTLTHTTTPCHTTPRHPPTATHPHACLQQSCTMPLSSTCTAQAAHIALKPKSKRLPTQGPIYWGERNVQPVTCTTCQMSARLPCPSTLPIPPIQLEFHLNPRDLKGSAARVRHAELTTESDVIKSRNNNVGDHARD